MRAIAIAVIVSPVAIPGEPDEEEDTLIISRRKKSCTEDKVNGLGLYKNIRLDDTIEAAWLTCLIKRKG